ncbi:molecular chaperone [Pedobacter sp. SYSU D00535]|uniref:fimbrial biogenesis chaperone n=1 Tax=Pedobacter sp. SYSU D00535 TaxID=2810308 RepID=UPI001A979668|nr:molecular chaperone [Pedobacter sp. SYSU D00535]
MNKAINALLFLVILISTVRAQSVSVAPSRIYYKVNPGESKTQSLKITNNSSKKQAFQITFGDFAAPGSTGKSTLLKPGESPNSLAKNISANPSFFELEAGESKDVQVILELPNLPESNKVKWGTMLIKLAKERSEAANLGSNSVGMGIIETFQFVVHLFQTPPSVTLKQAEIVSFKQVDGVTPTERAVAIVTKNTGEAILDCASYVEYVNLKTGKKERLKPAGFTVLPGGSREMKFVLPTDMAQGKYTVTGVVDYGSKEDVQAAEMDLEIK